MSFSVSVCVWQGFSRGCVSVVDQALFVCVLYERLFVMMAAFAVCRRCVLDVLYVCV